MVGNFLLAVGGPLNGTRFSIGPSGSTVIGREEGSVRIRDETVSGRHARIDAPAAGRSAAATARHTVVDLGSLNGTYVNDVRLEPGDQRGLTFGDRLRLGDCVLSWLPQLSPLRGSTRRKREPTAAAAAASAAAATGVAMVVTAAPASPICRAPRGGGAPHVPFSLCSPTHAHFTRRKKLFVSSLHPQLGGGSFSPASLTNRFAQQNVLNASIKQMPRARCALGQQRAPPMPGRGLVAAFQDAMTEDVTDLEHEADDWVHDDRSPPRTRQSSCAPGMLAMVAALCLAAAAMQLLHGVQDLRQSPHQSRASPRSAGHLAPAAATAVSWHRFGAKPFCNLTMPPPVAMAAIAAATHAAPRIEEAEAAEADQVRSTNGTWAGLVPVAKTVGVDVPTWAMQAAVPMGACARPGRKTVWMERVGTVKTEAQVGAGTAMRLAPPPAELHGGSQGTWHKSYALVVSRAPATTTRAGVGRACAALTPPLSPTALRRDGRACLRDQLVASLRLAATVLACVVALLAAVSLALGFIKVCMFATMFTRWHAAAQGARLRGTVASNRCECNLNNK